MNGGDAIGASRKDFCVGTWQVEVDLGQLRHGETEVYLRPQLMQVLLLLAEEPGTLVSAKSLIERVWARRFVSPSVLARSISDLRRALGDSARSPVFIETLPKRGYRLRAGVRRFAAASARTPESVPVLETIESVAEECVASGWHNVFVGRTAELGVLGRRLQQAAQGRGAVVFVTGEPGSGKTVLLREFLRRATATHRDLLIATGKGNAHGGSGEALGLFRGLLSLLTGDVQSRTAAGDLDPEQADRLWRAAPQVIRALLELAPGLIGGLLPAGPLAECARAVGLELQTCERLSEIVREQARSSAQWHRQEQLTGQIVEILLPLASRTPLALLLDDLQWCDSASSAMIFELARALPHQRLLVVGAYRPGDIVGRDGGKGSLGELAAELRSRGEAEAVDLDHAAGRGFVDAFLDAEPNCLDLLFRSRFTQCTAGSPLFTVELLRAMQETRMIVRGAQGHWEASPDLDWRRVPGRLQPVIAQRIGRLPQRLRQLLNVAAVEGEEFTAEIVAAVLGRDLVQVVGDLGQGLERRHQLVVPLGVQRVGQGRRSTYRFRHTLFQSWLYAQIGSAERVLLHERIGRAIERLYQEQGGQLAHQLARHFEAAGLPEKAMTCYLQAARQATRLAADQDALQLLRSGLGLLDQLPPGKARDRSALELHLAQGLILIALRGYAAAEVRDCLAHIRELCHQTGEQAQWFMMLWQQNISAGLGAQYGLALEAAEEMVTLAPQFQDANAVALASLARGWVLLMLGRFDRARADLERVLAMNATPQERAAAYGQDPLSTALAWSSWIHWFRGDVAAARDCSVRSIALARESNHPLSLAFALGVAGASLHSLLEEPEESLRYADEVQALSTRHGLAFYSVAVQLYRGFAHFQQGCFRRSAQELAGGLAGWSAAGTKAYRAYFLMLAGLAHHRLGQADEALRFCREAIEHVERTGERMFEPEIHRVHALVLSASGEVDGAKAELCRAIKVARQQGSAIFLKRALASLAELGAPSRKPRMGRRTGSARKADAGRVSPRRTG